MEACRITLRVGETYSIQLAEPGSTGYGWEYVPEAGPDIVKVSIKSLGHPPVLKPGSPFPGSSSTTQLFIIRAVEPGKTCIRLKLLRPWEHDKQPLREILLEIEVRERARG